MIPAARQQHVIAETELTRARLDLINARADARVARVSLDHALGRDARVR